MDVATYETSVPSVLVTAADDARVAAMLSDVGSITTVAAPSAVDDAVAEGGVDCVVVTAALAGGSPGELVERVRARDEHLPVVFAPDSPAPGDAAAVTRASATAYLPLDHAEAGELSALVRALVAEADDRRQADRERELFRVVMEHVPHSVYVKDDEARHVAVSARVDKGMEERVVGKTDRELFGEDGDVPESYEDDLRVLESGESIEDREERVEVDGGETLWFRTTKVPWRNEAGEVVGLVGTTLDVSAEKRREQELEREKRRLEQFASFASHDLRNPVTVAQGFLEEARETDELDYLDYVAEELDRMEQLIEDLLDIARPDENREEEWTALSPVVERSWTAIDAPDANLTVSIPDDLQVRATSGALRQLLENVLSNAVDHGGPGVDVEVGLTETGFYVADDGPGIPEEDRDRVFEYGFTTDGTGVGLAIAAEIAAAHGWVPRATESEAGGARVEFQRTLRRRPGRPDPTEGDALELGEWRTVGELAAPGGAEAGEDGAWTLRAGGRALWGGIEEYGALCTAVDGGVRIEARVTGVEQVHEYSKAGLLLTDAIEPDSPLCFVGKTAAHGTEVAWRSAPGEPVDTEQAEPDAVLPRYYRIDRVDDRVTVAASADGDDWTLLDQHVLPLSDPVVVGLAVNSHDPESLCEATVEEVRVVELEAAAESDGTDDASVAEVGASERPADGPSDASRGDDGPEGANDGPADEDSDATSGGGTS